MSIFLRLFGLSTDDNKVDEATGLTEKQKKLVTTRWAPIKKDPVTYGTVVMTSFFRKHPDYQKYFESFKDVPLEDLPDNKRFQAHASSVITALSSVIDSINDPGLLVANLSSLAQRHKKRGQTKEQFENLKEVILEVLRELFGKQNTPEMWEAWEKTMDVVFAKIYEAYAD